MMRPEQLSLSLGWIFIKEENGDSIVGLLGKIPVTLLWLLMTPFNLPYWETLVRRWVSQRPKSTYKAKGGLEAFNMISFLWGLSCYSPLFLAVRAGWHVWKLLNHGAKTLFKISLSPYREENSLLVSPLSAKFDYDRSRILYCQKQLLHKFGNYLARCGKFSQGKQFMNTVRGNFRQL